MMRLDSCHSEGSEESQFISGECVGRAPRRNTQRRFAKPVLSGVEGLNVTNKAGDARELNR